MRDDEGVEGETPTGGGDPLLGQTLAGRYRVEEALGSGAMGTVYAAEHVAMRRTVALKVMRPELMKHDRLIRRFQREAQAASRIESPHVVTLYDFGHDESGLSYLAMERLSGESLGDRLRRVGSLSVLEALEVAMGITRALEAAHGAGVVHRDLKPDNVFITDEGVVKVLDFGIAKIFEEGSPIEDMSTFTSVGAVAGTPLYMSPEAARRQPVGPAADLYAVGILMYQMISGSPPFEHDAPIMVMGMHIRSRPQRLSRRCPELALPQAIDTLVKDLLAKKPERRPTATECLERLGGCREQLEEIETEETSVMSRKELPLEGPAPAPTDVDGWGRIQDTVPSDEPIMYEDVLAEVERREAARRDESEPVVEEARPDEREGADPEGSPETVDPAEAREEESEESSTERGRPTMRVRDARWPGGGLGPRTMLAAAMALVGLVVVAVALASGSNGIDDGEDVPAPVGREPSAAEGTQPSNARGEAREESVRDQAIASTVEQTPAPAEQDAPSTQGDLPREPDRVPAARTEPPAEESGSSEQDDRATLRITSRPAAEILLDGAPTGHRTPATLFRVRTGDRRISLTTDDGRSVELEEELVAGETHRIHHEFRAQDSMPSSTAL